MLGEVVTQKELRFKDEMIAGSSRRRALSGPWDTACTRRRARGCLWSGARGAAIDKG